MECEGPDLGQGPARLARQVHLPRAHGSPERRDERHADDGADAALQDPEPVPGLGRLGQAVADHDQDRYRRALPRDGRRGGYGPRRRHHRAAGDQDDRAAAGPQRPRAAGVPDYARVPGRS
jgi:hypothetical protein